MNWCSSLAQPISPNRSIRRCYGQAGLNSICISPTRTADDRRAIFAIYNQQFDLRLTETALAYAVKKTAETVEGAPPGTFYTGDHIDALCRAMARIRLRENYTDPANRALIDRAMTDGSNGRSCPPRKRPSSPSMRRATPSVV